MGIGRMRSRNDVLPEASQPGATWILMCTNSFLTFQDLSSTALRTGKYLKLGKWMDTSVPGAHGSDAVIFDA